MDTGKENDPSYGIDRAAFNQGKNAKFGFSIEEELSPTLVSKGPNAVSKTETHYTVRRLTPTECARLQGFPDWWCSDLGNPNPTDEELKLWMDVWETHRQVISHASKPKSRCVNG
ncbi:MAG: DNA cytosine methyltransferase [Clostridiales bacterium]|nr:DNA cytosine methyltransferase [Clostridiales bacterium]